MSNSPTATVNAVFTARAGDELVLDAVEGDTTLFLDDVADFAEEGGTVVINDAHLAYVSIDDELSSITLAEPLAAPALTGDRVELWDDDRASFVQEVRALVAVPGTDDNDDAVEVTVAHPLVPLLPEGIRSPGAGEAVILEWRSDGPYAVDLVARQATLDGGFIDPTTVPDRLPTEPPAASPTLTATGTPNAIILRATPVEQTTQIAYHLSTTPEFTADETTLLEGSPTRATIFVATATPDGAPLVPGTAYYFRAVATNVVGDAEPSPVIQGSLDLEAVRTVIAEEVVAGFILTGSIQVGNILIDANEGIIIPQLDGGTTYLRADGSGNTFAGEATLDAATILGKLNIRGLTNFINGRVTLGKGVTDPNTQPTVATSYSQTWLFNEGNASIGRRGLLDDGALWLTVGHFGTLGSGVEWHFKDGSGMFTLFNILEGWLGLGGLTRVGDRYYVLAAPADGGTWVKNNWRVLVYDATTFAYEGSWATGITTGGAYPAIGTDGTNIVVGWASTVGHLLARTYTTAGVQVGSTLTLSTAWGAGNHVAAIQRSSVGFGGVRTVVASNNDIFVYNGSTRVPAEEWPRGTNGAIRGLTVGVDGRWHSMNNWSVTDYTLNSGTWDFAYTWTDTDPAGLGTAETRPSPVRQIAPARFARWTVTLPEAPPDDGTTDGANTATFYAAPAGGALVRQIVLPEGTTEHTFDATGPSSSGVAAPVTSGFAARPSTAVGQVVSSVSDALSALITLNGDGSGRVGPVRWDASGAPVDAIQYARATTPLTLGTTAALVTGLSVTITSNGTGDIFKVIGVGDFTMSAAGGTAVGGLYVDGVAQDGQILASFPAATSRGTFSQTWVVTDLPVGTHTIQLRASKTSAGGTWVANSTHSTLMVERVL